jgi:hypothetical protein
MSEFPVPVPRDETARSFCDIRAAVGDSVQPSPPMSQTAGLARPGETDTYVRKVMIMRVFAAGGAGSWGGWVKTEQDPLDPTSTGTGAAAIRHLDKAERELGWKLRHPSWRQGIKEESA